MTNSPPVLSSRLYEACRQFISEFLSDKIVGQEEGDTQNAADSVADCKKIYIFSEEDLKKQLISKISGYYTEKHIRLRTKTGYIRLDISDINFVRRENDLAVYHMRDKRTFAGTTLRTSFKVAVKELIEDAGFIMAGVSRAFNPERIERFHKNTVIFDNGEEEYLSDRLYYPVKKRFEEYQKETR